jgi:hypothetical protein
MTTAPQSAAPLNERGKVPILIDGTRYVAPQREMTGAQLRALPTPPIGADRDLWLDLDGGLDRVVGDDEIVELHPQLGCSPCPR